MTSASAASRSAAHRWEEGKDGGGSEPGPGVLPGVGEVFGF